MPERSRDAALAGFMLLVTALLCGGIGAGVGVAIGAPALLGILGLFIGFGVGFALVYSRFKDL
jgi:ABC-type multidrug transport system permease subunit